MSDKKILLHENPAYGTLNLSTDTDSSSDTNIFFWGGDGGEDQWEAWKWSCDLRVNERPKKNAPDGADKQTRRQTTAAQMARFVK